MSTVTEASRTLWTYDSYSHGERPILVQRTICLKHNDVETWYEEVYTHRTFDPWFVEEDKEALRGKVVEFLQKGLDEATSRLQAATNELISLARE